MIFQKHVKGIGPVFPPDWGKSTSSSNIEVVLQPKVFEIWKNCKLCIYAVLGTLFEWIHIGLKSVHVHSIRAEINVHYVSQKDTKHDSWWLYFHFSPLYYTFLGPNAFLKGLKWYHQSSKDVNTMFRRIFEGWNVNFLTFSYWILYYFLNSITNDAIYYVNDEHIFQPIFQGHIQQTSWS